MGSFRLKRLVLKNFRSFRDAELEFQPSGITLIRGKNFDTGGSSYAGKSSIPVAVALALGACPFSAKEQRTWGTKSGMSVCLDFETDGGWWSLTRSDKSSLRAPDGELVTGAAAVDARLRQELGVGPEVLMALTYRPQQERGLFLSKTDSEKKEFLSQVLGLEIVEAAADAAWETIKASEVLVGTERFRVQQLETQLRGMPEVEALEVEEAPLVLQVEQSKATADALVHQEQQAEGGICCLEEQLSATQAQIDEAFAREKAEAAAKLSVALVAVLRKTQVEFPSQPGALPTPPDLVGVRSQLSELGARLNRLAELEQKRRREYDHETVEAGRRIRGLAVTADGAKRLERDVADKDAQIRALEDRACPTCQQEWVDTQAIATLEKWRVERQELWARLEQAHQVARDLARALEEEKGRSFQPDPKVAKFQELHGQLREQERDLSVVFQVEQERARSAWAAEVEQVRAAARHQETEARQAVTEAELAVAAVQVDYAAALDDQQALVNESLRKARADLQELRSSLFAARQVVAEAESTLRLTQAENAARRADAEAKKAERERVINQLTSAEDTAKNAEDSLAAEQDFADFIGYRGFLGSIFDEILAEITEETNAILASVANVAHVTVHFMSEVLPQKGGQPRREIRPMISIGGFQASLKSGASGGQQSSIYLAVDLAVAKVVSRRTNSWPGWMFLDESFEGLDVPSKETCMSMLQQYAGDRLLLVVDHSSELKTMFSNFVDIEFKNGESMIRRPE